MLYAFPKMRHSPAPPVAMFQVTGSTGQWMMQRSGHSRIVVDPLSPIRASVRRAADVVCHYAACVRLPAVHSDDVWVSTLGGTLGRDARKMP